MRLAAIGSLLLPILAAMLLATVFIQPWHHATAGPAPGDGGCITQNQSTGVYTNNCAYGMQRYTVATLPSCPGHTGLLVWVSDAQSPSYGGALTGGGSTPALAFCGGATWNAH